MDKQALTDALVSALLAVDGKNCRYCRMYPTINKWHHMGYSRLDGLFCEQCIRIYSKFKLLSDMLNSRQKELQQFQEALTKLSEDIKDLEVGIDKLGIERHASVELTFCPSDDKYNLVIRQNGKDVGVVRAKRYEEYKIRRPLGRIKGRDVRVPWKQVLNGYCWNEVVELSEYFLEDIIHSKLDQPKKILSFERG